MTETETETAPAPAQVTGRSWRRGYKLRRDIIRKSGGIFSAIADRPEILSEPGKAEYYLEVLGVWATEIVSDFDLQRSAIRGIPTQMQDSRLDMWDKSCGRERYGWKVCARTLEELRQDVAQGRMEGGIAWEKAVVAWDRALALRQAVPGVREVKPSTKAKPGRRKSAA
jgi:hypothetical protein